VGALVRRHKRYIRRCVRLNRRILPYVSTANVARDMDLLRAAVGDRKLTYLGFPYGTFLGATYESMFPRHTRALVLDGALDRQAVHQPPARQPERADGRLRAGPRALHAGLRGAPGRLPGLRGRRPLVRVRPAPRPARRGADPGHRGRRAAGGRRRRPRRGGAGRLREAALARPGRRPGERRQGRRDRPAGAGRLLYGWLPGGTYDPLLDRYFTISALEQRYLSKVRRYLREGRRSYRSYDHA
jgi:pimeloyl-ACP methyl ester carboxylesterase